MTENMDLMSKIDQSLEGHTWIHIISEVSSQFFCLCNQSKASGREMEHCKGYSNKKTAHPVCHISEHAKINGNLLN